jgi:hypothetical protein
MLYCRTIYWDAFFRGATNVDPILAAGYPILFVLGVGACVPAFLLSRLEEIGTEWRRQAAPLLRPGSERPGRVARLAVGLAFHVWNSGNDAVHDRDTGCLVDKRKVKRIG